MEKIIYTGVVEDRNDPLEAGRVRVRVFGVHSELLSDVPVSSLPWAIPLMPSTSASLSGIGHSPTQYLEGSWVKVYFEDGESKQQPVILGSFHGIPMNKSPFGSGNSYTSESVEEGLIPENEISTEKKNTTSDETKPEEKPVEEGKKGDCCSGVDTSKAVKKYGSNVDLVCKALCDAGIKNKNAIIAILSNVGKESNFKLVREGLNYSSTARLRQIFPSKFKDMPEDEARSYLNNESKLANLVYSNRYGNGSVESGDGFAYRGGGFIQLTFKGNYKTIGSKIGTDLVGSPSSINDSKVAAKAVAQYFVDRYGGASRISFGSLEEALADITRKVNPGGFTNDFPKVKAISALFSAPIDEVKPDVTQPNKPENDLKPDATQKEIDEGIVNGKPTSQTPSSAFGFSDPNKKYPLEGLLKEQDTNRLSRRNTLMTLVEKKIKNRRSDIPSVGSSFSEPAPPYNSKYPFNQVYASESGHVLEFDDTAGSERINLYHTSGTYTEIDKFGNHVNKIIGDGYSITERNGYIYIDGTARLTVGSDVKIVIGGSLDIQVEGDVNYDVGGSVTWKVGGDLKYGVGGINSINSGGNTSIDSPRINLNSGTSAGISSSARGGSGTDYPPQVPENFVGRTVMEFDDDSEEVVDAVQKEQIASGEITQKELDDGKQMAEKPVEVDDKKPPPKDALPESCAAFSGKTDIPDGTQLSKYFTLAMLSSRAVVSRYKVVPQKNLKVSEIVCNLKKVAENCLDPIKAKYPNMKVTSGFRTGSGTSQHLLGEAADMQFDGVSKSDYFAIAQWIKENVLFDKLLLEYKTTGTTNPWIHISYKNNPRKEVFTYMNDKNTGSGLRKLA